jgi:hypothetical protein
MEEENNKEKKEEKEENKGIKEKQEIKNEEKDEIKIEQKNEEIKIENKDNKEEIKIEEKKEEKETKKEEDLYQESTEPFMQIVSKELIEIINKPGNRKCFDCDSSPANWVCVNNAIFLCSKCAGEHRGYGTIISNLKFIMLDKLNEFQIEIMKRGGNDKLDKLLQEYKVDKKKIDKLILYSSKLMEYHRDYLYNKLAGKNDPKPPTKFDSKQIMSNFKDNPRPPLEKVKTKDDIFIANEKKKEEKEKTKEKEKEKGNCKAQ